MPSLPCPRKVRPCPNVTGSIFPSSPPDQTILRFRDRPLDFPPGEKWSYSNSNYVLLGKIIERVAGQAYEDCLRTCIFEPHASLNLWEC
jgi:hypothetical protein